MRPWGGGLDRRPVRPGAPAPWVSGPSVRRGLCALVGLAACTPVSTRPDFRPDPRALVLILNARPERVIAELTTAVPAESLVVARVNVRDGYLETAWYDTQAHRTIARARDVANLAATVKIRCWADPYVPGQTRLTIEPVARPRIDPSRPERDLEVLVVKPEVGYELARRLAEKLKERFGVPKAAR
jgi:hypothetical protein